MRTLFAILIAALSPAMLSAQRGAPPQAPAAPAAAQTPSYAFPSGAGVLLFYVKPDKTAQFESVLARIDEALSKTPDPARHEQAASWRIYRSVESTSREAAVYMFVFDPAIAGADYDPVKLLSQELPAEAPSLYQTLKDAVVRVERMALTKMR